MEFVCPRCGNKDPYKIGNLNGRLYCRECISFRLNKHIEYTPNKRRVIKPNLSYDLSNEQKEISKVLVKQFIKKKNSLVNAVCGAGKTEIVLEVICYAISKGMRIAFAIPRRDVVIELAERFRNIFPDLNVLAIYGGHIDKLEGDLLVLTTHQLFRYQNYFDLIIVDEIDAFPFAGSKMLMHQLKNSLRGNYIYLSATPSDEIIKEFDGKENKIIKLFARFHHHPLPVPKIFRTLPPFNYLYLIYKVRQFVKVNKPVFVFCPTINLSIKIFKIIKLIISSVECVHSKKVNRKEIIQSFKEGKIKVLVTTAILERGVTFKDLQVIIFNADHEIYTKSALIQISGRVGRKKESPEGEVIYICEKETNTITESIKEINLANIALQKMLSENKEQ